METLSSANFTQRTFNGDLDVSLPPRLPDANGSQRRFGVKLFEGGGVWSGDKRRLCFSQVWSVPEKRSRGKTVAVTKNHVYPDQQRSSGPSEHRAQRQPASRSPISGVCSDVSLEPRQDIAIGGRHAGIGVVGPYPDLA